MSDEAINARLAYDEQTEAMCRYFREARNRGVDTQGIAPLDSPLSTRTVADIREELLETIALAADGLQAIGEATDNAAVLERPYTVRFQRDENGRTVDIVSVLVWDSGNPSPAIGASRTGRSPENDLVFWDGTVLATNRSHAIRRANKMMGDWRFN